MSYEDLETLDRNECEGCGCEIEHGDTWCWDCEPDECEDCGVEIGQGEEVCDRCASDRDDEAAAERQREKDEEFYDALDEDEEDE